MNGMFPPRIDINQIEPTIEPAKASIIADTTNGLLTALAFMSPLLDNLTSTLLSLLYHAYVELLHFF